MSEKLPPPSQEHYSHFMCAFIQFLADEFERVGHDGDWSPYAAYLALCDHQRLDGSSFVPREFAIPCSPDELLYAKSRDPVSFWRKFAKREGQELLLDAKRDYVASIAGVAIYDVCKGLHKFAKAHPEFPTKRDSKTVCKYA